MQMINALVKTRDENHFISKLQILGGQLTPSDPVFLSPYQNEVSICHMICTVDDSTHCMCILSL